MTRSECEERIKVLFNKIIDIYREYNPDGEYFTASMTHGRYLSMNNACYGKGDNFDEGADYNIPIDTHWQK
jgi:hypothetical protein